ncbi:hypothetical protein MJH12_19120 [bacterium]|nr:hypothetical protein [bacterium]
MKSILLTLYIISCFSNVFASRRSYRSYYVVSIENNQCKNSIAYTYRHWHPLTGTVNIALTNKYEKTSCKNLLEVLQYTTNTTSNGIYLIDFYSGGQFITDQFYSSIVNTIHNAEGYNSQKLVELKSEKSFESKVSLGIQYAIKHPEYRDVHPFEYLLNNCTFTKVSSKVDDDTLKSYTKEYEGLAYKERQSGNTLLLVICFLIYIVWVNKRLLNKDQNDYFLLLSLILLGEVFVLAYLIPSLPLLVIMIISMSYTLKYIFKREYIYE